MAWNDQTAPQRRPDVRPRWKKKRYWIPTAGLAAFVGLGAVAAVTAPPAKDASSVVDQSAAAPTTAAPVTTTPRTTAPTIRPTLPPLPPKTLTPRTTRPPVVTAAPTTRAPAPQTVAPAPTTRPRPAPTTVRPKPVPVPYTDHAASADDRPPVLDLQGREGSRLRAVRPRARPRIRLVQGRRL